MPRRSELTISKRTVDRLSVEKKDATFWDRELPGFGVRVYPSGSRVYIAQGRSPAGIRRVTLGRHGAITPEQARKKAGTAIARIRQGEDPEQGPPVPVLTVADLAERYMEAHVEVRCNAHTQRIYGGSLRNHILPALGAMPLASVGRAEVAAFHYGLRETPRAANRALMVLSKIFSLAEAWGLAPGGGNPCRFVLEIQGGQARALSDRRRVPQAGPGAVRDRGRGSGAGAGCGGAAAPDADRVPERGDTDAAVERRRPQGRGASPARRPRRARAWCR